MELRASLLALACALPLAAGCGGTVRTSATQQHDADGEIDAGTHEDAGAPSAPGGGDADTPDAAIPERDAGHALRMPPPNAVFDYQLGGGYPPDARVQVVSRDRTDRPLSGVYNICYVNGFQTQASEAAIWQRAEHRDLLLSDGQGRIVEDPDWNEQILDIRTPQKRARLAAIVGEWIAGCARAGFDAIEIDNLDTYARARDPSSQRPLLSEANAVAFVRLLADRAHALGLAIAQKNAAELVGRRAEMGTDFVVAEECNAYSECDVYTAGYGDFVFVIEYRREHFQKGCSAFPELSIVLRDVDLRPASASGYLFDDC